MAHISGKCLCGNITFTADTEIKFVANCHCDDCRQATGSAYGTLLFVDEAALKINGTPKTFSHTSDRGTQMDKLFCADCGSQLFSRNSGRPNVLGVRAGTIAEKELVVPDRALFMTRRIPSTPVDPDVTAYDGMPV